MEIEYKYRVPPALFDKFAADPSLRDAAVIGMEAAYFDTPDRMLRDAGVTLRLRRETPQGQPGAAICCVKLPAPEGDNASAGLRRRLEYECEAESVEAGLSVLLARGIPPEPLRAALSRGLIVTARVSYIRREALVKADGASYTVCLDRGTLGTKPFSELEVEHKSGIFGLTAAAALALAERWGLEPEPLSKYARALL